MVLAGLSACYLGVWALALLDLIFAGAADGPSMEVLGSLGRAYFLLFALLPLSLHAIVWLQRRRAPSLFFLGDLTVALLVLNTAIEQAQYLAFGPEDRAPSHLISAGIVVAAVGLWRWHWLGCGPREADGFFGTRHFKRWFPAWSLLTIAFALWTGACIVDAVELYPRSGALLVVVAWVLTSSLLFSLARVHERSTDALALTGLVVFIAFGTQNAETRLSSESSPVVHLAAQTAAPQSPHTPLHLDFDEPARFDCRDPGERIATAGLEAVAPERRRNVFLISVDAVRKEAVGSSFKRGSLMPNLKAFAKRSTVFSNAFTTYPATLPALGGAMTGWSASELLYAKRFPDNVFARTRDAVDVQQLVLPGLGWFKLPVVDELLVQETPATRLKGASKQVNYLLGRLKYLREKERSLFAWIHFVEPRRPYQQQPGFRWGKKLRNRYRSELAYTDQQIGRLLEGLEEGGWLEDSLIIIFADHGEAQGERGYYGHHVYLNGWMVDIPMIVYAPGLAPGEIQEFVQVIDVLPTVLQWFDLPIPKDIDARSLFETIADPLRRMAYAEAFPRRGRELYDRMGATIENLDDLRARLPQAAEIGSKDYEPKVSVIAGNDRLIANRASGEVELIDRSAGARERAGRGGDPQDNEELLEKLRAWHHRTSEKIYCRVLRSQR